MCGRQSTPWLSRAIALIGLYLALTVAPASADRGAEAFTQNLIDGGFAILRDTRMDEGARVERFQDYIVRHLDARKAAMFTLGRYRRGAPENVIEAFVAAFADYSTAIYGSHLVDYRAATLRITGSITNKPGDVTVMLVAEGANLREPLRIAFRLSGAGSYKLVDVQVAGIWLSIEQRDQFASVLAHTNGDIPALTASLRDRAARMRSQRHASR